MTCAQCGNLLTLNAEFCASCGSPALSRPSNTAAAASAPSERLQALAQVIWKLTKAAVIDPVDGLPSICRALSKRQAMEAGIVLGALYGFILATVLCLRLPEFATSSGLETFLKLLLIGLATPLAMTGLGFLARKVCRATQGSIETDLLIAGTSLIPITILWVLFAILGIGNLEALAVLAIFAVSYTILILYATCTHVSGIRPALAAPTIPIMVILSGWLTKIVLAGML